MAVLKVETDIITNIAASHIGFLQNCLYCFYL